MIQVNNIKRRISYFSLLIIIWLIPGVLLSLKNYSDSFLFFRLLRVIFLQQLGFLDSKVFMSGYEILIYSLINVPNLPITSFIYYPIGSILLPFTYFAVTRSITKSTYIAIFSSIYISYLHSLITVQFNSFVYTWANILIILFIFSGYKYMKKTDISFIIILQIMFFSSFILYHTTTGWMVAYVVFISFFSFLLNRSKTGVSIALSFFVTYVFFEKYIYTHLLPSIASKIASDSIQNPFAGILNVLSIAFEENTRMSSNVNIGSYLVSPISNPIMSASTLITVCLLILPFIYLFSKLIENRKSLNIYKKDNIELIFIFSVGLIGSVHLTAYYFYSGFSLSLRPILLLYPLVIPLIFSVLFKNVKYNYFTKLYYIFLIFSVIVGFIAFNQNVGTYENIKSQEYVSNFLIENNLTESISLISDLNTFGCISVNLALKNEMTGFKPFDNSLYAQLIGDFNHSKLTSMNDFIFLLTKRNYYEPIIGFNWNNYAPLNRYSQELNSNAKVNKIYTDGYTEIKRGNS